MLMPRSYRKAVIIFLILFSMLVTSRFMLHASVKMETVIGFLVISALLAAAAEVGYMFRWATYQFVVLASYVGAVAYLLYASWTKASDGWSDVASLFTFLAICLIGIASGLAVQSVQWWFKK